MNMKKKIMFIFLISISLIPLFGAKSKYYYDYQNGYSGYASADYLGSTKKGFNIIEYKTNMEGMLGSYGYSFKKCAGLSKQESFLLWSAIDEYNRSYNDCFEVMITEGSQITWLVGEITNKNGVENFSWYGYIVYM